MTKAQGTALDRIDQAAMANGWDRPAMDEGPVTYKKRGRGYLTIETDSAGRVVRYWGARRMNGTDPYPQTNTGKVETILSILTGETR
jgi:hypothetical protein